MNPDKLKRMVCRDSQGLWGCNKWRELPYVGREIWRDYYATRGDAYRHKGFGVLRRGEYLVKPGSHRVSYMVTITDTFPGSMPIKHCESVTYSQAKLIYTEEKRQGRSCSVEKVTTETVMECKGR